MLFSSAITEGGIRLRASWRGILWRVLEERLWFRS
jgi:hypothetical protein